MEEEEDNFYMTSIHDRYAARPESLGGMCLAKFAVNYEPICNTGCDIGNLQMYENDDDSDSDYGGSNHHNDVITLKNNLGQMHKRKCESILHVKSYRQNTEPEKYYHSHLILYLPWWNEDELLGEYATDRDHYLHASNVVEHNAQCFYMHSEIMDAAINDIADNGPPEMAWDSIAPTIGRENVDASNDDRIIVCNIESKEDDDKKVHDLDACPGKNSSEQSDSRKNKLSTLFDREAHKDIMSNAEYRNHMCNLNECQCKAVMFNRRWCKEYV